jgi:alpha-tubulin suppressor-like RCC1 family protein
LSNAALPVPGLDDVEMIAAGGSHTCALSAGHVSCWGLNDRSQLGRESTDLDGVPQEVSGLDDVVGITAGPTFTCAIDDEGAAWCWGSNDNGERGDDDLADSAVPHRIDLDESVTSLSAGGLHTCAVTPLQTYCWGDNFFGQLGIGRASFTPIPEPQPTRPLER